jgi:hypothetical protein
MGRIPVRGMAAGELGLALLPERMPLLRGGRPLRRWRYVGVYHPDLMLCAGRAQVAGVPQRWWAVALPDGTLLERSGFRKTSVECNAGRLFVAARGAGVIGHTTWRWSAGVGRARSVRTCS